MKFLLTNKAYNDLKDIARYTQETWGVSQRDAYLAKIDDAFHQIAANKHLGRKCDHIKKGYFSYHVGRHLVFYRVEEKMIVVVRVLHQSMDVESQLGD